MKHTQQLLRTHRRNGTPIPTLENTTAAVCNPGVTVELEPSGVSGGGREVRKLNCQFILIVVLQHYWCTSMVI